MQAVASEPETAAALEAQAAPRLEVRALTKSYRMGANTVAVLNGIDLAVTAGEIVAIMGPSGSGKTTLLNCISGIDTPDGGEVTVADEAVDFADETALTLLRRHRIGMVFQFFNLVPTLTVRENVLLPFLIAGAKGPEIEARAETVLARVGLGGRSRHYPAQLSGGEMQLVSIARALAPQPDLVLADEPTGNVNPAVGRSIMAALSETAKEQGAGVVLVTHSPEHAARADRVAFLKDGVIAAQLAPAADGQVGVIFDRLLELGI